MAEDARLLADAEEDVSGWRVYGWTGPWVSLGCYQDPHRDILHPDSIPWVMRPTGGKAVLHGHDVTVGLALPLSLLSQRSGEPKEKLARSLKAVYRHAIAPIVSALRACGVPAALGEELGPQAPGARPQKPRTADCFAVTSPNDIIHEQLGVKVCGCALKLTSSAVLVQASIPAGVPLVDPASVFAKPSQIPYVPWNSEEFSEAFATAMEGLVAQAAQMSAV